MASEIHLTLTGVFEAENYPFWAMRRVISSMLPLAERGGRRASVVAVKNQPTHDYRLKIWLESGAHVGPLNVELNGQEFELEDRGRGFFQGAVNARDLTRALDGPPPCEEFEDENFEPDIYLDACVETTFQPQPNGWMWRGDVSGFPSWMRARSIEVTPPTTTGGWHYIKLDALGVDPYGDATTIPAMRVNGIWCLAHPLVDEWDSQNRGSWGGRWSLTCAPDDLALIRQYDHTTALEDEPVPPRSVWALWSLHQMVGLPRAEYDEWKRDVKNWTRAVSGLSMLQGQVDEVSRRKRESESAIAAHNRIAKVLKARSDERSWAKAREEEQKAREHDGLKRRAKDRLVGMRVKLNELYKLHDEALMGCTTREAKYESAIAQMFPDYSL